MLYEITPGVKHRSEEFGGVADSFYYGTIILNEDEYRLLLQIESGKEIGEEHQEKVKEFLDVGLISLKND
jgi:CRISPR/Cas system-associated protein Cas7 (RAMP superfamily)